MRNSCFLSSGRSDIEIRMLIHTCTTNFPTFNVRNNKFKTKNTFDEAKRKCRFYCYFFWAMDVTLVKLTLNEDKKRQEKYDELYSVSKLKEHVKDCFSVQK